VPKISNAEISFIRSIARRYAMGLWVSPFNEGLLIYSETFEALYIRSARWKFCLKCGVIEPTELMVDEGEISSDKYSDKRKSELKERIHECTLGVNHFPVLITTSWYKLREFFMSKKHIRALENAGVTDKIEQIPIIREIFAVAEENNLPEVLKIGETS
jgi:hypothetical protein